MHEAHTSSEFDALLDRARLVLAFIKTTTGLERVADEAKKIALRGVLRELISYMIEDPRTISSCLDMVFVAKSLERIGDHATNIFEHVIYAVRGEDLRHASPFASQ